jgi:hypothetical protein
MLVLTEVLMVIRDIRRTTGPPMLPSILCSTELAIPAAADKRAAKLSITTSTTITDRMDLLM